MQDEQARRLIREIPETALVLDVGGGAAPFPRADWVIDAIPFDALGAGSHKPTIETPRRFSADTWVEWDLCDHKPWPFQDKRFDFVTCSHLLEDIRDPIWVCSELQRVGKAGYIEVPSRYIEQSKGIENPRHCGFYHHRWLITLEGDQLTFRMKPHCLSSFRDAWVAQLGIGEWIAPAYEVVTLNWTDQFKAHEVMEFRESEVIDELCAFAAKAKEQPNLIVRTHVPPIPRLKRMIYRFRLMRGRR